MSFLLWQRDASVAIGSPRLVYRAAEVPLLGEAQALCERLHAANASAAEQISRAADQARAAAHAEGYAAGRAAGAERIAETLTALAATAMREREAVRADIAALALEVVRKLAGGVAEDQLIAALAANAARDLLPAPSMALVVHTSRVTTVRAELARVAPGIGCEIRGEADVPTDACCLVTEHGSIDASLDAQLARLASAWGVPQ